MKVLTKAIWKDNKGQAMNEFGREIIIDQDVVYVGEGENPKDNLAFQMWEKSFKEVYGQSERSKREDFENGWHKEHTKEHICIWSEEWLENAKKTINKDAVL